MTVTPRTRARPAAALTAIAVCAASAWSPAPAEAAGIERVTPSARILFRPGNYVEIDYAHVRPDLRGRDADLSALGGPMIEGRTGNIFDAYSQWSFALRGDLAERLSYAIFLDQPWGANTTYTRGSFPAVAGIPYAGTRAELRSYALTTLLAYDVTPNVKVYGGLRAQRTDATAAVPFVNDYTITTDRDWSLGWVAGAGYHIPEMALAVALTYHSRIRHDFETVEYGDVAGTSSFDTPQSVTLDFQSGVNENTLVFGSVRWTEWSAFEIAPPNYPLGVLVEYDSDWWTYNLGVARRLNDNWAAAFQVTYEPRSGDVMPTLGPTDGMTALGASLTYTTGGLELTGGLSYGWLGSTRNALDTRFRDGTFTGVGFRIGYSF